LLAAIERAERHHRTSTVSANSVAEHLGFKPSGTTTSKLRPTLEQLIAEGAVVRLRRRSREVWGLTAPGRQRLARVARARRLPVLPESPQHKEWRHYRTHASDTIELLREQLSETLQQAATLLNRDGALAEDWRCVGRDLRVGCSQLATATYCLYEWREPDDTRSDRDARHRKNELAIDGARVHLRRVPGEAP
jgi:hypothetical protein